MHPYIKYSICVFSARLSLGLLRLHHVTVSANAVRFQADRPPRSFVRLFVQTDLVTMTSSERLEQS